MRPLRPVPSAASYALALGACLALAAPRVAPALLAAASRVGAVVASAIAIGWSR